MSAEQLNGKVGRFLLENLELFGVGDQKAEVQKEIRRAGYLLQDSNPHIHLDMQISEIEDVLSNPPMNDIDSAVGNRLGKIFKPLSKNIPYFAQCEHTRVVAIAVKSVGLIAKDMDRLQYDEMNEEIGKVIDLMKAEGAIENTTQKTIDAATRIAAGFRDIAATVSVHTAPVV